jgi:hypothetical protein
VKIEWGGQNKLLDDNFAHVQFAGSRHHTHTIAAIMIIIKAL